MNIFNSNANRNSENVTIWSHITSSLLSSWINEKNPQRELLIIDSRCLADYEMLHISNAINVPYSKIIKRKLLNDKISIIELLMKNSTSTFLIDEVNIVVYDNHTEHTNQLAETVDENSSDETFAFILLSKIAQKFKSVSFLQGGFVNFKENYSDLCSRTNYQKLTSTIPTTITSNHGPIDESVDLPTQSNTERLMIHNNDSTNEPSLVIHFKRKKHVLKHSISSYDTNSEFFRSGSLNLMKNTHTSTLDTIPSLSSNTYLSNDEKTNLLSNDSSPSSSAKTKISLESPSIREPTRILSYLYLGSQEDALSSATLKALGIDNVLNVSISCPKPDFIADANFLRISVNDGHAAKIRPFFDVAYRFIEKCRKANSKVIIHCLAGISRSPTLAIAYLMRNLNLRSDDAYKFVKEKRPTISPNFNFLGQLYEYDRILVQMQQQNQILESPLENEKYESNTSELKDNNDENSDNGQIKQTQSFLKLNKKIKSPCSSVLNNVNQLMHMNENESKSDHILMEASPKHAVNQRRKQFVFPFSSNNPNTNNENMCTTPPATLKTPTIPNITSPMVESSNSLLTVQSPISQTLSSPSQAFSKFNLNSPTVTSKSIVASQSNNVPICSLNESNNKSQKHQLTKSFTFINRNEANKMFPGQKTQRPLELVMRRPTNLLMSSYNNQSNASPSTKNPIEKGDTEQEKVSDKTNTNTYSNEEARNEETCAVEMKKTINSLKRPSSILFDTANSKPVENVKQSIDASENGNRESENYTFLVNPLKFKYPENTLKPVNSPSSNMSQNSATISQIGTSTCSCSPNSRSSSSLSMTSSSVVSLSSPSSLSQQQTLPISLICTSCSNSLAASQQIHKKKMKLSPVQDRCVLSNFQMSQ